MVPMFLVLDQGLQLTTHRCNMIFIPKGVINGEVVDPNTISRDYNEASKISEEVSHYQFREGEFSKETKFDNSICKVLYTSKVAQLMVTRGSGPVLPIWFDSEGSGATAFSIPNATGGTALAPTPDSDLFQIPYNKGFHVIDDTTLSWESTVPELVHITFSFQYCRAYNKWYQSDTADNYGALPGDALYNKIHKNRLQTAIRLDDVNITGSGPNGVNTGDSYRGTAYTARSLSTTINIVQLLPAGIHNVSGVAALAPATKLVDNEGNQSRATMFSRFTAAYASDHTTLLTGISMGENCCIGTRNMLVVRYGRGKLLRG